MTISVALCVYNGERYLGAQLESIARQSRLPDELVVTDDVSSDRSQAIVEEFTARVKFPVRFFRNETNLRVAKNFEKAIGLCEGEVIVTADQDDVWYPQKLERIEAEFARSPDLGLVFSDADLIGDDGQELGGQLWASVRFNERRRRELARGDAFSTLLKRPIITGASMAFRSKFRPLILPIPSIWLHDEWIGFLIASVSKLLAIPEPLLQYRKHSNNQVGVIGVTAADRTRASFHRLSEPREVYFQRARLFEELRVCLLDRLPDRPDLVARIDQKIAHFRVRGSLPQSKIRRIPTILRELASLRYSRYSGNTITFARDFLAK
jgi:glycosyltransferase involved in cell wall biosynthesis